MLSSLSLPSLRCRRRRHCAYSFCPCAPLSIVAMSATDLVLCFQFSSNPNADARTVQVAQVVDETNTIALYKVRLLIVLNGCSLPTMLTYIVSVSPSKYWSNHWRYLDPTNKRRDASVGERRADRMVV